MRPLLYGRRPWELFSAGLSRFLPEVEQPTPPLLPHERDSQVSPGMSAVVSSGAGECGERVARVRFRGGVWRTGVGDGSKEVREAFLTQARVLSSRSPGLRAWTPPFGQLPHPFPRPPRPHDRPVLGLAGAPSGVRGRACRSRVVPGPEGEGDVALAPHRDAYCDLGQCA